jgi:hypothetical protein
MAPAEAAAREEIRELVARYAQYADRGRFDDLVALFIADGVLCIDDREPLHGRAAIRAFLDATAAGLRGSGSPALIRHHVTTLTIDVTGADTATGAAYFLVVSGAGPDHWGLYRDRYVRLDGAWRFAERRVRVEGFAPGSAAARRRAPE